MFFKLFKLPVISEKVVDFYYSEAKHNALKEQKNIMDPKTHPVSRETPQTQGLELLALHRITELIGSAVDLGGTLSRIFGVLSDTLRMERATLVLYEKVTQKLTIKASCGLSGAEAKAFITFHGGLATPEGQDYSKTAGSIFVFHGTADTAITMEDFASLAAQLETAGVSHEMVTYSGAPHAFTVFGSERYREEADKKSWQRFIEVLDGTI